MNLRLFKYITQRQESKVFQTPFNMFYILCSCLFMACNDSVPITEIPEKGLKDPFKENMMTATNYVAKSEETEIDSYIKRRKWNMERLDDGLRIWEYKKGTGNQINYEDIIVMDYNIESITGKMIYKNVRDTIKVGKLEPNVGIDKAVRKLHYGSKAKIILPSHLGYGIIGDGDRITRSSILIYDIEILNQ